MILMMKDMKKLYKMKLIKVLFLLLIIEDINLPSIVLIENVMKKIILNMIGYPFLILMSFWNLENQI